MRYHVIGYKYEDKSAGRKCSSNTLQKYLKYKQFTLIELLVVIAIISILMTILLPGLKKAREKTRSIACLSNVKQHVLAFMSYAQDNNGFTPAWYNGIDNDKHDTRMGSETWRIKSGDERMGFGLTFDYTGPTKDIYYCPLDRRLDSNHVDNDTDPPLRTWEECYNSSADNFDIFTSYVYRCHISHHTGDYCVPGNPKPLRTSSTAHATASLIADWPWDYDNEITNRHKNGCNVGFMDGHARYIIDNKSVPLTGTYPDCVAKNYVYEAWYYFDACE